MTSLDGSDEGVVSFGDDDDMADLFSFGLDSDGDAVTQQSRESDTDYSMVMASVMPRERSDSDDSFLAMLEGTGTKSQDDLLLLGDEEADLAGDGTARKGEGSKSQARVSDKESREMLEWLEQDDPRPAPDDVPAVVEDDPPSEEEVEVKFAPESTPETLLEPSLSFDSIESALASPKATIAHFRDALESSSAPLPAKLRPHLWSRVLAPDLPSVEDSDEAKAFREWEASAGSKIKAQDDGVMSLLANRIASVTGGSKEFCQKALVSVLGYHYHTKKRAPPKKEVPSAVTSAEETEKTEIPSDAKDTDAADPNKTSESSETPNETHEPQTILDFSSTDPLMPPIVCTLLSSGMSTVTAAVLLKRLLSKQVPLVPNVSGVDRGPASNILHKHFYLLACYHLPLLVYHLDRHVPNWYEAAIETKKEGDNPGVIPLSWFFSHMAGECTTSLDADGKPTESAILINPKQLLSLWDFIMISEHHASARYFLILALLEAHSGDLLLLNGEELEAELTKVLQCRQRKDEVTDEGFSIEDNNATSATQAFDAVQKWISDAQTIWEATPTSVLDTLAGLESHVINQAIRTRQRREAQEAQLRAEAAARAQQAVAQAEHEQKAEAARLRLTRARLVAFYRTHNPGKEDNIDKIMKNYEGRYEILDAKLRKKYGVGFNPAIKPKTQAPPPQAPPQQQQPATNADAGNQGFGSRFFMSRRKEEEPLENLKREKMVASVSASEILPIICWSKKGAALKALRGIDRPRLRTKGKAALPPRYYLVDSRPESSAQEQGSFPTSVSLSPEIMLDAEKFQAQEAVFESLRGVVHICVMGEGYGALPALYGHKMTRGLHEHIKEDQARTLLCALYFVKKGYPFVSIFEGGFASAHAWLWRKGAEHQLYVQNVLTNYDAESMFGQFEKLHQEQQQGTSASTRDKKQRVIQNLFDSSVTRLTKAEQSQQGDQLWPQQNMRNMMVNRFFKSAAESSNTPSPTKEAPSTNNATNAEAAPAPSESKANQTGQNFFGNIIKQRLNQNAPAELDDSSGSLEVESVEEFEKVSEESVPPKDAPKGATSPAPKWLPTTNTFAKSPAQPKPTGNAEEGIATQPPSQPDLSSAANPNVANLGNRFAGFGAALKNTTTGLAGAAPQAMARNPFARFSRNVPPPAAAAAPAPAASGFAGLNMLRKSALARVRSADGEAASGAPSTQTSSILMAEDDAVPEDAEDIDRPSVRKV